MQDWTRTTKDEVEEITQGAYRAVSFAGKGKNGDVWFCVRLDKPIEDNRCIVYAVKIMVDRRLSLTNDRNYLSDIEVSPRTLIEIQCLEKTKTLPSTAQHHFQQLVDYDSPPAPEMPQWISTRAVMGCTFNRFLKLQDAPMPRPLVLNFALQFCNALKVLRNHNPPILHGDLFGCNVMVDFERRDDKGVPTLVLIDFQDTQHKPEDGEPSYDLRNYDRDSMYGLVEKLVRNRPGLRENPEDAPWIKTLNDLDINRFNDLRPDEPASFESFHAIIEDLAHKAWENISVEDKVQIEELLEKSSRGIAGTLAAAKEVVSEHADTLSFLSSFVDL